MLFALHSLALAIPGFLRLGRLHIPIFGIFAAVAVIAALWLSQRTARFCGLAPQALWDEGWFAVLFAFVASRVLLIAENWSAFLRFPVLLLALPSLTYAGIALTGVALLAHLRFKRILVLAALDAWSPCAALFAAIISLGHFVEGTDAGMPTRLPWGIVTPGDTVLGRVHPVQLYTMLAAFMLCVWSYVALGRPHRRGRIAAQTLILGGVLSFALDMLRQPVDTFSNAWLDPEQWVALGAVLAGLLLFAAVERTAHNPAG